MEHERPVRIESRQLMRLYQKRTLLLGELSEVEAQIQRLQLGVGEQEPVRDRFLRHTIDFNQTRAEQAGLQSDTKL